MTPLRHRMLEDMQIRNLSPHTQTATFSTSLGSPDSSAGHRQTVAPRIFAPIRCILQNERKLTPQSTLIAAAALRFLYKLTLKRQWTFEEAIPTCKKPQWDSGTVRG
jgi:integrase/recombinase XerD